jgi:hypothetical protein
MRFGRLMKRGLLAAIVVSAGGVAAVHPKAISSLYLDVYPTDPAKRQALELCFLQDERFNRLDADERENCYRHVLMPVETTAGLAPAEANPIDLRRAAALGHLPRNDIRRTEQTQDALHLPH